MLLQQHATHSQQVHTEIEKLAGRECTTKSNACSEAAPASTPPSGGTATTSRATGGKKKENDREMKPRRREEDRRRATLERSRCLYEQCVLSPVAGLCAALACAAASTEEGADGTAGSLLARSGARERTVRNTTRCTAPMVYTDIRRCWTCACCVGAAQCSSRVGRADRKFRSQSEQSSSRRQAGHHHLRAVRCHWSSRTPPSLPSRIHPIAMTRCRAPRACGWLFTVLLQACFLTMVQATQVQVRRAKRGWEHKGGDMCEETAAPSAAKADGFVRSFGPRWHSFLFCSTRSIPNPSIQRLESHVSTSRRLRASPTTL
jgi:hypothetical protein